MTLEQTLQKIDNLTEVIQDQNLKYHELFQSDVPADVILKKLDASGNIVTIIVPNRAKVIQLFQNDIQNHNHDVRYFTETEADNRFAGKDHSHTILDQAFVMANSQPTKLKLSYNNQTAGLPFFEVIGIYNLINGNPVVRYVFLGNSTELPVHVRGQEIVIDTYRWTGSAAQYGDVLPVDTAVIDLGSSAKQFDAIFCRSLTQSSDERIKKEIEESKLGLDFIMALNPVSYIFKDTINTVLDDEGNEHQSVTQHSRRHYGLIAQEVEKVLQNQQIETKDFAGFAYDQEADLYSLRYMEFIAPMIKAIQELKKDVEELKQRIK